MIKERKRIEGLERDQVKWDRLDKIELRNKAIQDSHS